MYIGMIYKNNNKHFAIFSPFLHLLQFSLSFNVVIFFFKRQQIYEYLTKTVKKCVPITNCCFLIVNHAAKVA